MLKTSKASLCIVVLVAVFFGMGCGDGGGRQLSDAQKVDQYQKKLDSLSGRMEMIRDLSKEAEGAAKYRLRQKAESMADRKLRIQDKIDELRSSPDDQRKEAQSFISKQIDSFQQELQEAQFVMRARETPFEDLSYEEARQEMKRNYEVRMDTVKALVTYVDGEMTKVPNELDKPLGKVIDSLKKRQQSLQKKVETMPEEPTKEQLKEMNEEVNRELDSIEKAIEKVRREVDAQKKMNS